MRLRRLTFVAPAAALLTMAAAILTGLVAPGCGRTETSGGRQATGGQTLQVYVGSAKVAGDSCPSGSTERYRETTGDRTVVACDACPTEGDTSGCDEGMVCVTVCGPGCEDDAGGCCSIKECDHQAVPG